MHIKQYIIEPCRIFNTMRISYVIKLTFPKAHIYIIQEIDICVKRHQVNNHLAYNEIIIKKIIIIVFDSVTILFRNLNHICVVYDH